MTILETARLRLRPVVASDAALLPGLITPVVSDLTANWIYPFTPAMAEERVAQTMADNATGSGFNRMIERREDDAVMGWLRVTLVDPESRLGSLGYWLSDPFQGKGYITEALPPFARAAIAALDLNALEAGAQHRNAASIAALQRLGMRYTGDRMIFVPSRQKEGLTAFYALDMSAFRPSR